MAVATSERTQTNFDVKAVWQYFNMEDVMCEALDKEMCHARLSRLMMELGVSFIFARAPKRGGNLTMRCFSASRASAAASSSCSTCKTVPNTCFILFVITL